MVAAFGRAAEMSKNGRFIDMTGHVFGALSVIGFVGSKKGKAIWACECMCGNVTQVAGNSLRTGNTKSCGCTRKVNASVAAKAVNTKHGMYGTPTYSSWQSMRARCLKPSHKSYADYGGRGITICKEWDSFDRFFADMGLRPEGRSLDRIKNEQGYSAENCKWSTPKEQANNRRNNIRRAEIA